MSKKDGGAAFPIPEIYEFPTRDTGMSLRDHFAGQALALYDERPDLRFDQIARLAYAIADAMLVERAK